MRDDSYLQLMGRLMDSIKQQVAAAVTRGATLEQTRKNVNLDEYRSYSLVTAKSETHFSRFTWSGLPLRSFASKVGNIVGSGQYRER